MGKRTKDMPIGSRFNKLTVVAFDRVNHNNVAFWRCVCDCGKETTVLGASLRSGNTKSCGCLNHPHTESPQLIDLSGKVFGNWTVGSVHESRLNKGGHKIAFWLCRCSCGVEKFIRSGPLRYGKTIQCKNCSKRLKGGQATRNDIFRSYRSRDKRIFGGSFLTDEQFDYLIQQDCHYCGAPPRKRHLKNTTGDFISNGLDRVDSSLGYTLDNIVPCCLDCNIAKLDRSKEDFISWILRAADFIRSKNIG